jgi:hypothetical protein
MCQSHYCCAGKCHQCRKGGTGWEIRSQEESRRKGMFANRTKEGAEETRAIKASGIIEEQSLNEPVCGRGAGGR